MSADEKPASVGGGSIWSENVYPNLEPHNLTVAGGRSEGIGVGGYVTGGGCPFAKIWMVELIRSIGGLNFME